MRCRWVTFGLAAALTLTLSAAASEPVKPAPSSAKDEARKLADEGQRLFDAGDYRGALARLAAAEAKFSAPTLKIAQAEAHEKLGELLRAKALYGEVATTALPAGAPQEFRDAQRDAAAAVARLEEAIPRVLLVLIGAPPPVLSIALDGATLEGAIWDRPVPLDPGTHQLVVEMSGRPAETRSLVLKEGETRRVEIRSGGKGTEARPAPAVASAPVRSYAAPVVAFGIGAAGLVAGAISGGLALAKMQTFRSECGAELRCPASLGDELGAARLAGHVSTVGFALAGAGAVMGTLLLVLPAPKGVSAPKVSVGLGPFGVVATGRF
jgi:hypothetical protein